ncbi:MAG: response regulator [Selenomonadaceae bacterium]|nr:response regulator [Selenomonadaceae bacterium]
MFKLLRKATKSDFYTILGILLLCLFRTTLSFYLELDTFQQLSLNAVISFLILVIVVFTLKKKIANQQELNVKDNLLKGLLQESRATLNKIISTTQNSHIKESAMQLNEMIDNIGTFNKINDETDYQPEKLLKRTKINKNLRKGIVAILIVLMISSLIIYTGMVTEIVDDNAINISEIFNDRFSEWWTIYGSYLLLGIIIFLIFVLCIIVIDLFIDRLFDWQDSVNKQLEKAIDNAYAAGKAKTQFFAQMSHEIRTPINAVIGMNEMILRECRDSTIINYANNASAAAQSLLSLINDILDFSKLESDKMELVEEVYQLDDLIRNLVSMIKFRAEKKNLDFRVQVNENIPNELFGDSTRIRQIVVNFLTNAVKYTKVGGIMLIVDMELGLDEDTGVKRQLGELLLEFSVKDSGIGIKDEDKSKLFKDFERFDAKQNKNIEGTGLGLAITAKLVKMMRGKIEVKSVYGEGSTFTVLIPQKVMNKKEIGRFEEKTKTAKSKTDVHKVSFVAPNAKILVVDDNEMNLLVATSLLKVTKIQVDTADSGASALKKMSAKHYDLIFLDQMMPELDGIQTLKLAKEMEENKSKGVPMIALTANAVAGAREMFLKEGFDDYLSKPIDAVALENMLMEYLPKNLLQEPTEENEKNISKAQNKNPTPQNNYDLLNVNLGLQYSAGMEDMYRNVLEMFCKLKDEKKSKIQEAFNNKNWNDYTTFVHALKSTSLSIGGEKISALAKQLEESGKILIDESTSESDKQQAEKFIVNNNSEAMQLYDKVVDEGRKYLGLKAEGLGLKNEPEEIKTAAEIDKSDKNLNADLQEAFDNEDWLMYSILIDQISGVDKNVKMACQMITSEFTNDQEKSEAIEYIKNNHAKLIGKK